MTRSGKLILGVLIVGAILTTREPGRVFNLVADDPVAYGANALLLLAIVYFLRRRRLAAAGTHRASSPLRTREPTPDDDPTVPVARE
jgi:hypothetical protein